MKKREYKLGYKIHITHSFINLTIPTGAIIDKAQ